jgi:hypothetical protein
MMPLGLNKDQLAAYHDRLLHSHDFRVEVDVLHLDEKPRGALTGVFLDGQVNLQGGNGVARTATFSLYDPERSLHLDGDSPSAGALFFDRMVRVRHIVEMPWGPVTAVPFCGPMTKIGREGDLLNLECQDKAVLAMEGRPPLRRNKGYRAVQAIRDFMEATGETRFRFQVPDRLRKKRLKRPYSVGWTRSAWSVCQEIADRELHGMQLVYACDGALLLRQVPSAAALVLQEEDLTTGLKFDYDASKVRNYVRVTGAIPAKQTKDPDDKKPKKFTEWAAAKATHPMSPSRLGRNGRPRYLPLVVEDTGIKKHRAAEQRARNLLANSLPMQVATSWSALPFFHLDSKDRVKVEGFGIEIVTALGEASFPLGLGGEASMGQKRTVSKPTRTGARARK